MYTHQTQFDGIRSLRRWHSAVRQLYRMTGLRSSRLSVSLICSALLLLSAQAVSAQTTAGKLKVYFDADRTHHRESARAIEMGLRTAFDQVGNVIQGRQVEFVALDHKANSVRSKRNLKRFLEDPDAIFIVGGLHSPPLLQHRDFINDNGILTVVPWAAAGPITRSGTDENWVFRLSIDDSKAGYHLIDFADNDLGCHEPHLLLEKTGWGKSNQRTMTAAWLRTHSSMPGISWFSWGITLEGARLKLRSIIASGADCVLMVANTMEGAAFSKAMAFLDAEERIPIVSHWGIAGGNFHKEVPQDIRENVDLYFIQTCFSFISSPATDLSKSVIDRALALFPEEIGSPRDLSAPSGFIHAYDLGIILVEAFKRFSLTGDAKSHRRDLRDALERIETPIDGLVKRYSPPFQPYNIAQSDAHEALDQSDFCMAQFGKDNKIALVGSVR